MKITIEDLKSVIKRHEGYAREYKLLIAKAKKNGRRADEKRYTAGYEFMTGKAMAFGEVLSALTR
jgi:hypothetical protein